MRDTPREVKIWKIVENDLPDDINITAREYDYAGWQFKTGMGVSEPDRSLAIKCYEKAAKMGYVGAMMSLATLYREDGNMDEYYRWILEAAFVGEDANAFLELGELYFNGEYVNQDYEKAYKYFEIASKNGADRSKYYIAYYADKGILSPRDEEKAILYYIGGAKEYDERCWARLDELHVKY